MRHVFGLYIDHAGGGVRIDVDGGGRLLDFGDVGRRGAEGEGEGDDTVASELGGEGVGEDDAGATFVAHGESEDIQLVGREDESVAFVVDTFHDAVGEERTRGAVEADSGDDIAVNHLVVVDGVGLEDGVAGVDDALVDSPVAALDEEVGVDGCQVGLAEEGIAVVDAAVEVVAPGAVAAALLVVLTDPAVEGEGEVLDTVDAAVEGDAVAMAFEACGVANHTALLLADVLVASAMGSVVALGLGAGLDDSCHIAAALVGAHGTVDVVVHDVGVAGAADDTADALRTTVGGDVEEVVGDDRATGAAGLAGRTLLEEGDIGLGTEGAQDAGMAGGDVDGRRVHRRVVGIAVGAQGHGVGGDTLGEFGQLRLGEGVAAAGSGASGIDAGGLFRELTLPGASGADAQHDGLARAGGGPAHDDRAVGNGGRDLISRTGGTGTAEADSPGHHAGGAGLRHQTHGVGGDALRELGQRGEGVAALTVGSDEVVVGGNSLHSSGVLAPGGTRADAYLDILLGSVVGVAPLHGDDGYVVGLYLLLLIVSLGNLVFRAGGLDVTDGDLSSFHTAVTERLERHGVGGDALRELGQRGEGVAAEAVVAGRRDFSPLKVAGRGAARIDSHLDVGALIHRVGRGVVPVHRHSLVVFAVGSCLQAVERAFRDGVGVPALVAGRIECHGVDRIHGRCGGEGVLDSALGGGVGAGGGGGVPDAAGAVAHSHGGVLRDVAFVVPDGLEDSGLRIHGGLQIVFRTDRGNIAVRQGDVGGDHIPVGGIVAASPHSHGVDIRVAGGCRRDGEVVAGARRDGCPRGVGAVALLIPVGAFAVAHLDGGAASGLPCNVDVVSGAVVGGLGSRCRGAEVVDEAGRFVSGLANLATDTAADIDAAGVGLHLGLCVGDFVALADADDTAAVDGTTGVAGFGLAVNDFAVGGVSHDTAAGVVGGEDGALDTTAVDGAVLDGGVVGLSREAADILAAADEDVTQGDAHALGAMEGAEEARIAHVRLVDHDVLDDDALVGASDAGGVMDSGTHTVETAAETILAGSHRRPEEALHVVVRAVGLLVQVDGVELEGTRLVAVEAVHHGDEPGETVLIIYMYVAAVGGDIAGLVVACHFRGTVVVGVLVAGGHILQRAVVEDIVVDLGIHGTADDGRVDHFGPVVMGAVVGNDVVVVVGDNIGGGVVVEGVEAPHEELGIADVGLGHELDDVALAEEDVGQVVAVVGVDILVDHVVVVAGDGGEDVTHGGVVGDIGSDDDRLVVAVADGGDTVDRDARGSVGPAVGGRRDGFPHRMAAEVADLVDGNLDILGERAEAGDVVGSDAYAYQTLAFAARHVETRGDQGVDHRGEVVGIVVLFHSVGHHDVGIRRGVLAHDVVDGTVLHLPGVVVGSKAALDTIDDSIVTRGAGVGRQDAIVEHILTQDGDVVVSNGHCLVGTLVAEGGAAEQVLRQAVDIGAEEDEEVVVALEVLVLVDLAEDGEVVTGVDGEADGVAGGGAGEPLTHADAGVGAEDTAHLDDVGLAVHEVGRTGTGEEDVGFLPGIIYHIGVEGEACGQAVDDDKVPPLASRGEDAGIHEAVACDVDGRDLVGSREHHIAAVDIDGAVVGSQGVVAASGGVVAGEGVGEVVADGHVALEGQRAAAGDADGTHHRGIDGKTIGIQVGVSVPVVTHLGTFHEGDGARLTRNGVLLHHDDGSEGLVGVGELHVLGEGGLGVGGAPIGEVVDKLQVAADEDGAAIAVAHHAFHAGAGTAVEVDILRCEDAGAADHNHRATIDTAGVAGQLVVVAVVADDLDGRTVAALDMDGTLVDIHLVDDGNDVALLIDIGTEGMLEGLDIAVGALADDGGSLGYAVVIT